VDKLSISNEMSQFDRKNRKFYDELTDEERKKFSNYLMIRWGSAVQVGRSSRDRAIEQYYLQSCNEHLNKHFFAINRHPKLQWLCATVVSPNDGVKKHTWIASKKKESTGNNIQKQLAELFPNMKEDELAVMAAITTKKELDVYLRELGREK